MGIISACLTRQIDTSCWMTLNETCSGWILDKNNLRIAQQSSAEKQLRWWYNYKSSVSIMKNIMEALLNIYKHTRHHLQFACMWCTPGLLHWLMHKLYSADRQTFSAVNILFCVSEIKKKSAEIRVYLSYKTEYIAKAIKEKRLCLRQRWKNTNHAAISDILDTPSEQKASVT